MEEGAPAVGGGAPRSSGGVLPEAVADEDDPEIQPSGHVEGEGPPAKMRRPERSSICRQILRASI
jgi:hypothetical protein